MYPKRFRSGLSFLRIIKAQATVTHPTSIRHSSRCGLRGNMWIDCRASFRREFRERSLANSGVTP
jgi:hypothetical protein